MKEERAQQIIEFLDALGEEHEKDIPWVFESWNDDEVDDDEGDGENEDRVILNKIGKMFGPFEMVSLHGGGEGEGEYVERIIRFVNEDIFIRYTGYYDSNNGIEFDGGFEYVLPRRTLKMVYETPDERGDMKDEI